MARYLIFEIALLLEIVVIAAGQGAAAASQIRIQVIDEDSDSSIEQAAVTLQLQSTGSSPELKFRTTDGNGVVNFGGLPAGEFEIAACRPDYIPSGWKRWNELTESEQAGTKVLKLKRGTTRAQCKYGDQKRRKGERTAAQRGH